jgi:hypothetical protein
VHWVNSSINGTLEIQNLELAWNGKQIFQGVLIKDRANTPVITIEELSTETSLWQLYKENLQGITEIKNLDAFITTDEKGQTNIEQIFKVVPSSQIILQPLSQLNFSQIYAKANFTTIDPFSFLVLGNSQQEHIEGSFSIDCVLNGLHITQYRELKEKLTQYFMTSQSEKAIVQARMSHFPTFLIKYLLMKKNFSEDTLSLLGDEIDFSVDKETKAKEFTFVFSTVSPILKSHLNGSLTTEKISVQMLAYTMGLHSSSPIQLQADLESKNFWKNSQTKVILSHSSLPIATLAGTISNLDSIQSLPIDWQKIEFDLNLHMKDLNLLQNLPFFHSAWLKNIQAFFGDSIELNMNSDIQNLTGPLKLVIEGSNGNLFLEGFCKEGTLTLLKPLNTEIKLHPLLSQLVFSQHMPLLRSAEKSEAPIQMTIQPDQFSCPLVPFQMEKLKIGQGILNLGKIHFNPTSELGSILKMFSSQTQDSLLVWFTPVYFELAQGQMSIKRVDILINHSYTLASWGMLNMLDSQGNFVIGLPASSLTHLFGIKALDPTYVLQVPVEMKRGKIEIDKSKFSTAIAALLAQTKSGKMEGWLNKLLDQVPASPVSNSPVPPPTTQPLPWGELADSIPQEKKPSSDEKGNKKPKIKNLIKKFLE